ncbi:MAG: hypothetical protein FJ271_30645 [Planctomycetes bacterium]|nr:hypothetical protein [Planctomycetota bacterium]
MKFTLVTLLSLSFLACHSAAHAQKAPEAGYVFPSGGKAGTTVDIHLGGYDWTPDMDYFVLDPRVRLVAPGQLGPILIPGPPYWFGARSRIVSIPLAREVPAKLVIPADVSGAIHWQAANANGVTSVGTFFVGTGSEVVEDERRKGPQTLSSLPVTVSGRIFKIEEVDRYRFRATKDGPITCELTARRLGAKFLAVLEVRDAAGRLLADVAGTNGTDPALTFAAKAGAEYVVSVHDVDFGGDRSYTYRLAITPGPRVVGAIPAAGKRGETREVEFVGYGVASGAARMESVKRQVAFPATLNAAAFDYRLETQWGVAPAFRLLLSDLPESVRRSPGSPVKLSGPVGITGVLERPDAEESCAFDWKKGQKWSLALEARRTGAPLDVALTVLGPDGKQLARNDDLPGTTDAGLEFIVPLDGTYQVVVSDMAGKSGTAAAIYRLTARQPVADFTLQIPVQRISVPIGGKFDLNVKATRSGGFQGPINIAVNGLPAGISVPANLVIPKDKTDLVIPLQAAKDAGTGAGLVSVVGVAGSLTRAAQAPITANLTPRDQTENQLSTLLVAATLKPRFKGRPVDQDTGRKVHRGSTFPAEVIVERLDGFNGEIMLQMAATQSYQMQGITGGEVKVPPGVGRAIYPCYMPEWLETTRTSRMAMVAVAKVPDPKGKTRFMLNEITGFITMTMEGALLKVSADVPDLVVPAGRPFVVPLKISRLTKLAEPVRLELRVPEELTGMLNAEPSVVAVGKEQAALRITPAAALRGGPHVFSIRATAMQDGRYPVISETPVTVEFAAGGP